MLYWQWQQVFSTDNHHIQDEGGGHRYYLCPLAYKFWWEHCFKHSNVIEIHDAITYTGLPHMLCYGGILTPLAPGSTYTLIHIYILSSWCTVVLVLVVVNCPVTLSSWVSASPPGWRSSHPTWMTPERRPLSSSTMLTSSWYGQAMTTVDLRSFFQLLLPSVCKVFPKAHLTAIVYLFD